MRARHDVPVAARDAYAGPRHLWRTRRLESALDRHALAGPVLDAGCGDATLAVALACRGRLVLGCDLDGARLRRGQALARERGVAGRVLLFRADVMALPLATAAFAGLAVGEVLEHVADDDGAVRELARVLAPDGVLVLTVPAGRERLGPTDRLVGHRRRYNGPELAQMLATAGLVVTSLVGWGFPFGRLYDRCIQRPAMAARGGPLSPWLARVGRWRWVQMVWLVLFEVDELVDGGTHGSGWLAVARKHDSSAAPR